MKNTIQAIVLSFFAVIIGSPWVAGADVCTPTEISSKKSLLTRTRSDESLTPSNSIPRLALGELCFIPVSNNTDLAPTPRSARYAKDDLCTPKTQRVEYSPSNSSDEDEQLPDVTSTPSDPLPSLSKSSPRDLHAAFPVLNTLVDEYTRKHSPRSALSLSPRTEQQINAQSPRVKFLKHLTNRLTLSPRTEIRRSRTNRFQTDNSTSVETMRAYGQLISHTLSKSLESSASLEPLLQQLKSFPVSIREILQFNIAEPLSNDVLMAALREVSENNQDLITCFENIEEKIDLLEFAPAIKACLIAANELLRANIAKTQKACKKKLY